VQQAREAARRTQCRNNMKQIGLALHNYHDSFSLFPLPSLLTVAPGSGFDGVLTTNSWDLAILPYIDQAPLYNLYNFNRSCWDPVNQQAVQAVISGYVCPSNPSADRRINSVVPAGGALVNAGPLALNEAGPIDYISTTNVQDEFLKASGLDLTGPDRLGWAQGGLVAIGVPGASIPPEAGRIRDITDGTSNTIMVGELADRNNVNRRGRPVTSAQDPVAVGTQAAFGGGAWANPLNGQWELSGRLFDGTGDRGPCAINCSNQRTSPGEPLRFAAGLYSFHTGGVHVLFADGSVHFLRENTDGAVFASLVSRGGEEVVGEF